MKYKGGKKNFFFFLFFAAPFSLNEMKYRLYDFFLLLMYLHFSLFCIKCGCGGHVDEITINEKCEKLQDRLSICCPITHVVVESNELIYHKIVVPNDYIHHFLSGSFTASPCLLQNTLVLSSTMYLDCECNLRFINGTMVEDNSCVLIYLGTQRLQSNCIIKQLEKEFLYGLFLSSVLDVQNVNLEFARNNCENTTTSWFFLSITAALVILIVISLCVLSAWFFFRHNVSPTSVETDDNTAAVTTSNSEPKREESTVSNYTRNDFNSTQKNLHSKQTYVDDEHIITFDDSTTSSSSSPSSSKKHKKKTIIAKNFNDFDYRPLKKFLDT